MTAQVHDIWLYENPPYGPNDVIIGDSTKAHPTPGGFRGGYVGTTVDRRRRQKRHLFGLGEVVAETLYDNLVARYGEATGRFIYYKMELEAKGPFQAGGKYDVQKRKS